MKYYSIARSTDKKIIGHYPQSSLKPGYAPRLPNGHWNIRSHKFAEFSLNYELVLNKKAKPTNYLDGYDNNFGYLVDGKFKKILQKFNLPPHRFYPIKVYQKDTLLEYYWFHFIIDDFWDFIDSNESYAEVVKFDGFDSVVEKKISITSLNQIIEDQKKAVFPYNIRIGEIKMKNNFPKYDVYEMGCLSYNKIISANLKNALINENLNGFETKLFNYFSILD